MQVKNWNKHIQIHANYQYKENWTKCERELLQVKSTSSELCRKQIFFVFLEYDFVGEVKVTL